jgi:hypothetical protein
MEQFMGDQPSASSCCTRHNRSGIVHSHRLRHVGREGVQAAKLGAHCRMERVSLRVGTFGVGAVI